MGRAAGAGPLSCNNINMHSFLLAREREKGGRGRGPGGPGLGLRRGAGWWWSWRGPLRRARGSAGPLPSRPPAEGGRKGGRCECVGAGEKSQRALSCTHHDPRDHTRHAPGGSQRRGTCGAGRAGLWPCGRWRRLRLRQRARRPQWRPEWSAPGPPRRQRQSLPSRAGRAAPARGECPPELRASPPSPGPSARPARQLPRRHRRRQWRRRPRRCWAQTFLVKGGGSKRQRAGREGALEPLPPPLTRHAREPARRLRVARASAPLRVSGCAERFLHRALHRERKGPLPQKAPPRKSASRSSDL